MSARLGVYTGEGLVSLIREQFNIRLGFFAVVCLMTANIGLVISEFAGIGAAFELLNVSRYISVPIAAVVIWGLVMFGSYRYVERVFLIFTIPFLAYPIAAIVAKPDWSEVGKQTVIPHFVGSRGFLVMVIALIGTTITPYMQLFQAAAVVDRGASPDDYRSARKDAVTGAIFSNVISMAIIIATAAAIGGTGALSSAKQAAEALRPMVGGGAVALFAIGLLGASSLAAAVVPLSTSYAISEAVGVERSVSSRFREAPLFLGLFTGQVVVGAVIALLPGNLINLLINTQVLNGLIAPVFLTFILVLANRRSVLGDAANKPAFRVLATVCVGTVGVLALAVVAMTVVGWF